MHEDAITKLLFYRLSFIIVFTFTIVSLAHANDLITAETFRKFSEVAGFEKQYNQMINIMVSNFQNGMVQGFENSIEDQEIPIDLRQKITPMIMQSSDNIRTNFENLFKNEVKFKDLVSNVYLPVYQKHFTEQDIIELIEFYNSPVGKKLSALTPMLMQESVATFNEMYGFRVQKIGSELIKQEVNNLIERIKSSKNDQ